VGARPSPPFNGPGVTQARKLRPDNPRRCRWRYRRVGLIAAPNAFFPETESRQTRRSAQFRS
jgi:hypothetical protein